MSKLKIYFYLYSFTFFIFLVLTSPKIYAQGYQPTGTVTPGPTYTQIKAAFIELGTLPSDTLAKVWPSVSQGARIGLTTVGAVASTVYVGSAAVSSKMFIPLKNGAQIAINMVGNIPKTNLAASALAVAKNPYFGLTLLAGSALFDWYQSSGITKDSAGNFLLPGFVSSAGGYETSSEYASCLNWIQTSIHVEPEKYHCQYFSKATCPLIGGAYGVLIAQYEGDAACSGWNYTNLYNPPGNLPPPVISTDEQLKAALIAHNPSSPASVLDDIVKAGETPETDPPFATSPETVVSSRSVSHPDGTSTQEDTKIIPTCSGDTCTFVEEITSKNKDTAGVPTSTTVTRSPPIPDLTTSSPPASTAPMDTASIVDAINNASAAEQAKIEAIPSHVLNDEPAVAAPNPPYEPDTDAYFPFLETAQPFTWNPASWVPQLPVSNCNYEIHRVIFGFAFDFAPCDTLSPLRAVLAWVFAVLTGWTVFIIIFRSTATN